jgi:hypothetical protein
VLKQEIQHNRLIDILDRIHRRQIPLFESTIAWSSTVDAKPGQLSDFIAVLAGTKGNNVAVKM